MNKFVKIKAQEKISNEKVSYSCWKSPISSSIYKSEKTENHSQEFIREVIKEVAATCYAGTSLSPRKRHD